MATHKFVVGQTLHFSPGLGGDSKGKGRYKVVRQLPESDGIFQYRIKSEMDGQNASSARTKPSAGNFELVIGDNRPLTGPRA